MRALEISPGQESQSPRATFEVQRPDVYLAGSQAITNIDIYTKSWCGSCVRAKSLLDRKGLIYTEIDVTVDGTKELEMIRRSGARTVPQIFIYDQSIGGYDDLVALEAKGDLDRLLKPERAES